MVFDLLHLRRQIGRTEQARMLRITIHETAKGQTIKLEGKIAGPWVEEFNRAWHSLAPSLGSRVLHLDLCGVAFIDANGRQLLREIYQKTDACFLADSPLTQYFADDARRRSPKDRKGGV
jgi:hypothetical protein